MPTTRVGSVYNILSLVSEIKGKKDFALAAVKSVTSNFSIDDRDTLFGEFQALFGEKIGRLTTYDKGRDMLTNYQFDPVKNVNLEDSDAPNCVFTATVQANLEIVSKFLAESQPFLLVGPEGCGKNLLIQTALTEFKQSTRTTVKTIHCNSQTKSTELISKLEECCNKSASLYGPVLRPKDCNRLIIYLKDINLPRPDEYNSIELISFLQQLLTHKGFYDSSLEFMTIHDNIQIVCSMNPSSDIGRHYISTRYTANVRILFIDYPSQEDLKTIYQELAKKILKGFTNEGYTIKDDVIKKIASMLVDLYLNIKEKLTSEAYDHY